MEKLIIEGTDDTPKIHFDKTKGKFEISGKSLPEDILKFYQPVLDWLKDYIDSPNDSTIVELKMNYFNSSSSKVLAEIISIFEKLELNSKGSVCISWHYNENDDEMKEIGEEFSEIYKVPFEFHSFN